MYSTLSPAQNDKLIGLAAASQAMIYEVARTGLGTFLQSVAKFQTIWNGSLTELKLAFKEATGKTFPSAYSYTLVVDGQYGPKTGTVLLPAATIMSARDFTFTAAPPLKASAMTTWLAQNQDAVAAIYQGAEAPPVPVVSDPGGGQAQIPASPSVSPNGNLPQAVQDAVNGSAATAMVVTTKPGPQAAQATYVDITPTQVADAVAQQAPVPGIVPAADMSFAPEEAAPVTVQHLQPGSVSMPAVTVLGTARSNKAPWIAGLTVLTVLGGAFWFMGRKGSGGRRRRAYA